MIPLVRRSNLDNAATLVGSALNPAFTIEGVEVMLHPLETVSIATEQLGKKVATLAQEGDRITGAMDELLTRAWA